MALSTTSRPKLRGADGSISEAGDQAAGSRNAPVLGHHRRGLVEQRALVLAVEGPGVRDIVEHILRVHAESARDAASERESNAASRRQGAPLGNGDEALGPEGPLGVDVQGLALAPALINRQLRKCASGQRFVRRIGRQAGVPGT